MRVILAALFVFAAMAWSAGLPERFMPWGMAIVMPLAMFLAFVLFDKHFLRRLFVPEKKYIEKQLEKGRAARETYRVSRALSFEDTRTGCMTHFLELGDGRVMVLYGQHMYEFEPIDDEPELNRPRRFPTSEFTVVRSLKNGELLDLEVGSEVIGTNLIEEPDDYQTIAELGFKLEDGEVLENVRFDEIETALGARG